jgi:hypothetical protein
MSPNNAKRLQDQEFTKQAIRDYFGTLGLRLMYCGDTDSFIVYGSKREIPEGC